MNKQRGLAFALSALAPWPVTDVEVGPPLVVARVGGATPNGGVWGSTVPAVSVDPLGRVTIVGYDATVPFGPLPSASVTFFEGRRLVGSGDLVASGPGYCHALATSPVTGLEHPWHVDTLFQAGCTASPTTPGVQSITCGTTPVVIGAVPSTDPRFPPGSTFTWSDSQARLKAGLPGRVAIRATVLQPGSPPFNQGCIIELQTDDHGNRTGDRALICWGDVLPERSTSPISNIIDFDQSSDGRTAAVLVAPSSSVGNGLGVWIDGTVVLRAGDVLPDLGWPIRAIWRCTVNRNGDWAAVVDYFDTTTPVPGGAVAAVIKNGEVLYNTSRLLPAFAGMELTDVRSLRIAGSGRVAFIAGLRHSTSGGGGQSLLVVDDVVVVHPGVTTLPGFSTPLGGAVGPPYATPIIDSDGAFLSFQTWEVSAPNLHSAAVAIPLDRSSAECRAVASAQGIVPRSALFGTTRLAGVGLEYITRELPPHSFGIALASRATTFVPGAGGAFGALCVGAPLVRSSALATGASGELSIDAGALIGIAAPQSGERWHFQTLYRDREPSSGAGVLRFGESISVVLD